MHQRASEFPKVPTPRWVGILMWTKRHNTAQHSTAPRSRGREDTAGYNTRNDTGLARLLEGPRDEKRLVCSVGTDGRASMSWRSGSGSIKPRRPEAHVDVCTRMQLSHIRCTVSCQVAQERRTNSWYKGRKRRVVAMIGVCRHSAHTSCCRRQTPS